MYFYCHGVHGSRPVPFSINQRAAMLQSVCNSFSQEEVTHLKSSKKSLVEYISEKLPPDQLHMILGVGGNTPCVEVACNACATTRVLFDLGTGISNVKVSKNEKVFHIFLTHFHYDHVQGLPFASWLYDKSITVHFYSPFKDSEKTLFNIMKQPYFPISMHHMTSNMHFHDLSNKSHVDVCNMKITWMKLRHPGGSYAYKVEDGKKTFCYFTDVDIQHELFEKTNENKKFLTNIDSMVIDAALGFSASVEKQNWGHTNLFKGISFCKQWNIKKAYLFHFDPSSSTKSLSYDYQVALWYNKAIQSKTKIFFSQENLRVTV